jgi:exodeoxyribonuclease-1
MSSSFLFYDLETSGFSPRQARIMQFAGQRTDMDLNPIGEPFNYLIKLGPDILPDPDAVLLTGITPQHTLSDGLSEAEFLKIFYEEVVKPETIFLGFNSIRFDDEFMRFLHYRNFYDAYGWQWKDSCSRWDILDAVRMTRALRPDGIEWPFASDGKPANKLEFLTKVNKIDHVGAHNALSDVKATIAVAKLVKENQPDLFKYLLSIRNKKDVKKLVEKKEAFIYTSGHFSSDFSQTSAVIQIAESPSSDAVLVYDLRYDPTPYLKMPVDQLIEAWKYTKDPDALRLPVKTVKYNRAPAVAPLGVIKDEKTQARIGLTLKTIEANLSILKDNQEQFAKNILEATKKMDESRKKDQVSLVENELTVDEDLYGGGFFSSNDTKLMNEVVTSAPDNLSSLVDKFDDQRLKLLLPLYKARNYPKTLSSEEADAWQKFCSLKLVSGEQKSKMASYFARLSELKESTKDKSKQYLIEELTLYGQSLLP